MYLLKIIALPTLLYTIFSAPCLFADTKEYESEMDSIITNSDAVVISDENIPDEEERSLDVYFNYPYLDVDTVSKSDQSKFIFKK